MTPGRRYVPRGGTSDLDQTAGSGGSREREDDRVADAGEVVCSRRNSSQRPLIGGHSPSSCSSGRDRHHATECRGEGIRGGYGAVYGELKALETLGVCQRGYFVEGSRLERSSRCPARSNACASSGRAWGHPCARPGGGRPGAARTAPLSRGRVARARAPPRGGAGRTARRRGGALRRARRPLLVPLATRPEWLRPALQRSSPMYGPAAPSGSRSSASTAPRRGDRRDAAPRRGRLPRRPRRAVLRS